MKVSYRTTPLEWLHAQAVIKGKDVPNLIFLQPKEIDVAGVLSGKGDVRLHLIVTDYISAKIWRQPQISFTFTKWP